MRYEQLRMMIAVIEAGSFSQAAERVHKSQAAISKAIKSLENELDLTLFSRNSYRPELTREGKAFYQKAKEVIKEFEQLELLAGELSLGVEPELNIIVSAICPLPSILEVIKTLTNKYPQTRINFSISTLGRVLEKIRLGEADIAITALVGENPTLNSIYLYDINMILVASKDFPLVGMNNCTRELLKNYNQIVIKNEHPNQLDLSDDVLHAGQRWDVNGLLSKKEIILTGLGWGQLPTHLITKELQEGSLVPLVVEDLAPEDRRVHIVRKASSKPGPVAQELWHAICQSV